MQHALQFVAFLVTAYGFAIVVWPVLRIARLSGWTTGFLALAVMFTPLVIGPTHVLLRAMASVLAIELFFKITDYGNQMRNSLSADRSFLAYAGFLVPLPPLLVRFADRPRRMELNNTNWQTTAFAILGFAACCVLLERLSHASMLRTSFLLDHTGKFVLFAIAIDLFSRLVHGCEQIAGYDTQPLINCAIFSKTVGEFWYRYNTRVHTWFKHNVFSLLGRRASIGAVFLTFFISGVLHEMGFAIATSRVDGYQFLFFMLQAPVVILGRFIQRIATENTASGIELEPASISGPRRIPINIVWRYPRAKLLLGLALHLSTILWMWLTSMLFFHGVDRVFPLFYTSTPWLP